MTANDMDVISAAPGLRVERVDPREFRQEIIGLCERRGFFGIPARFDWYYRNQDQPTPITWVARASDGVLCGLCSVTLRTIRLGDRFILAGVLGNLVIDRSSRATFAACALIRAAKALVARGELHVLLGVPNQLAEPLLLKMGFRVIDRWQTYALLFRCRQPLRDKFGLPGALLSPAVDLAAAVRRLCSDWRNHDHSGFTVTALDEARIQDLPIENWKVEPSSLVVQTDASFLRWRFLREPIKKYEVFGIIDAADCSLCGYVALHAVSGRLYICDCRTDARKLSVEDGILVFCQSARARANTVWVSALYSAPVFTKLARSGFFRIPASLGGYPAFPLVGFWAPDHPLASAFAQPAQWNLFPGFNDV